MLKVRVAELNRTGIREIGADVLVVDPKSGTILGTRLAGASVNALAALGLGGLLGEATSSSGPTRPPNQTAFGIFPSGDWEILLRALRENRLLSVLAEPNLMAMDGHQASFLAGGEFPVPVPQSGGGTSGGTFFTIHWKRFGVQLDFVPYIVGNDTIRLHVLPEVSARNEAEGVSIQGTFVPGIDSRRAETTVELREGQTLVIAGLLQVTIQGDTARIPGLGDLPYIGPFFSNTTHQRVEKELLVMVTPFLVSPMEPGEVPPSPGDEVKDPNDLEFYLMNRIEGRTGADYRSSTGWDDPLGLVRLMKLERKRVCGPVGFSD
jgi:pilus assembly protein CpaC